MIEDDLAADPGSLRLARLRLILALVAMAFVPIALAAPLLSTALDSQRTAEQAQVDRDATVLARSLSGRLSATQTTLTKTGASSAMNGVLSGTKSSLAGAKAVIAALSGDGTDGTVVAALLDARGRQVIRAVDGQVVKNLPVTTVDPLVGAALASSRGSVATGDVIRADDGTAHLAFATPVLGGTRSATPIGVVRVEVSLDRLLEIAGLDGLSSGSARLVDRFGSPVAPATLPAAAQGATIAATAGLNWQPDWTVRIVAPSRFGAPSAPLVMALVGIVAILILLIAWMARQVLRPARELEDSRGRLRDLYELARVDSLRDVITGLGNHRAFQEAFERQVDASRTRGAPLGLVLIDLDDFRSVNDAGGHMAGDQALAEFGRLIQATLRASERAFRTGGDEFALLLPGAGSEAAASVARRLLAASMETRAERGAAPPRSFSAGVSACPRAGHRASPAARPGRRRPVVGEAARANERRDVRPGAPSSRGRGRRRGRPGRRSGRKSASPR